MTIANLRRKWPRLIQQVENEEHRKFKRKPTLRLHNGRPRTDQVVYKQNGRVSTVMSSHVLLNKRMAKSDENLAVLTAKHELRECLLGQHDWSKTKRHTHAQQRERRDRRKLGLNRSYGWYAREFWKPKSQSSLCR